MNVVCPARTAVVAGASPQGAVTGGSGALISLSLRGGRVATTPTPTIGFRLLAPAPVASVQTTSPRPTTHGRHARRQKRTSRPGPLAPDPSPSGRVLVASQHTLPGGGYFGRNERAYVTP